MTAVSRAKAVIDALANTTVTNEKAETIVRLYVNNEVADVQLVAGEFLRRVTEHIKSECRRQAGKRWESALETRADAENAGYGEMPAEPEA